MNYSYQEMRYTTAVFYPKLTNEMRELPAEEAKSKRLIQQVCLFPWECLEEETAMCHEKYLTIKEFNYENFNY